MSQAEKTPRRTAFIFDRDEELGRLEGALNREVTLVEFPVVMVNEKNWVPFSRVGKATDPLGEAAHIVMEHNEAENIEITTRTMNVSDFYAEVVDRRWDACA